MARIQNIDTLSSSKYIISNYKFLVYIGASSAVLQLNKDVQNLWRYDALQWHNVTTKHRKYDWITSRSVVDR
jgi:hypothetical protein